jgi:arylsulfatase A-like enzyme
MGSFKTGVSPIIAEIMLIGMIAVMMSAIVAVVIVLPPRTRHAELEIRLENGLPPNPLEENTFDTIRVIIRHEGGDPLGIPQKADDEFLVRGSHLRGEWDNEVPWDNWEFWDPEFSGPADAFEFGVYAVGYLRHDDAEIRIGDKVQITVVDLRTNEMIFRDSLPVENSLKF